MTAAAQTQSNIDTARFNAQINRVNQYTPYGSLVYSKVAGPQWDEQAYLAANPDVRASVGVPGGFKSGLDHYTRAGQFDPGPTGTGRLGVAAGYKPGMEDQWQSTVTLSPEEQQLMDLQNQAQTQYGQLALSQLGKLQGLLSQPIDFSGAPAEGSAYQPGGQLNSTITPDMYAQIDPTISYGPQERQRVEDALFARMQPQADRDRAALENRLANQGLSPGTTAYSQAMDDFGRQQNDARLGVVAQGGQEEALQSQIANLLFGQRLQSQQQQLAGAGALFGQQTAGRELGMQEQQQGFNQQDQLRKQYLTELLSQRQVPLNELSALLGGSQVQYPNFQNTPNSPVANTDVLGAYQQQYQAQQANYNAALQQRSGLFSGLSSLGGAALTWALSDRRAKENIRRVGKTDDGQSIYSFNYKGGSPPQLGLMAQDVERRNPEAVATDPGTGLKMVDYQAALFGNKGSR